MVEILRGVRADRTDRRSEKREGLQEVRARLSAIERQMAGRTLDTADIHARYDQLVRRIERIEERLELAP